MDDIVRKPHTSAFRVQCNLLSCHIRTICMAWPSSLSVCPSVGCGLLTIVHTVQIRCAQHADVCAQHAAALECGVVPWQLLGAK